MRDGFEQAYQDDASMYVAKRAPDPSYWAYMADCEIEERWTESIRRSVRESLVAMKVWLPS